MRIAIIGGGPAGISLAYFLRGYKGLDVTVYEGLNRPGLKPCAWGLLRGLENFIDIPKESIITEIKRFRIFLDGELVYDISYNEKLGYIIDKPLFLEKLAEKVNIRYNSRVILRNKEYFLNNEKIEAERIIIANGHYSLSSSHTIPAIQYLTDYNQEPETVDFYFFSNLLGYGWIFPDRKGAKIGIGGWAEVDFLKNLLDKKLVRGRILYFHGARVSDTGIIEERLMNGNYVGEALGAVYAITGEGIRPSILSSKIMADAIVSGKQFSELFRRSKLYWTLQVHAKIIQIAKKSPNGIKRLSEILLKTDPRLILKLAMGEFDISDLINIFGRVIIGSILSR
ncbi:MAG: NAD(P)/FAD-dependent oxidoreductase [Sulfolobaceae archaeon]